ncbi:DNA polymerase I [Morganella morganii subsp. morganii]|uniref:DNA-directed DNA polymerase n=1 Tax=Morganella morganii TaxID=582 RepID=A0AAE4FB65_MORMO|nr:MULTISPECIES: DNA polymerase [Morganellaceae]ELA7737217.1 DNA polymerase I [Morganella morganii]ELY4879800.1 DNA polymerase I [Morganella morganii]MBT0351613.1 DNA polymerase I [Morganella morganii subsp. morganii]MCD4607683.1 DNA polymerase [Proteus mirabilis]MDS0898008.1 DNA polymerase [Morganella morganii]
MKNILWLDLETFSEKPIKYGTHSYAETVEIMLFAWAINNSPVNVWDITDKSPMPAELKQALTDPDTVIFAHNSHFDRTMLNHAGIKTNVRRWRDTMVQALAHGLPGALAALCEVLGVPTDKAKDKEGKALIQLFCKPRPKNSALRRATGKTHPEEWKRFIAYAGLDIEAMREVHKRLPAWNYKDEELEHWHRDQEINDRGVCMDVRLAAAAIEAVEQEQKRLARLTQDLTDNEVQAATQRDALLQHISSAFGVDLPDMQKSTLERRISDPDIPLPLRELLAIRLQASTTSTSKYKALMNGVSADGRLRGTLQFCGASRTGRWAGRLFQPQNLPRPTLDQETIDNGIEALKAGCADLIYDDIMQLTSSALRGCIMAPEGKKLVVSDLSNIEGRMLAWLAGEAWKIKAFSEFDNGIGADLYKLAYARAFNISPDDVDKHMRQIGKVMELGLGYGGGVAAFLTFALTYGLNLDELADAALPNIPPKVKHEALNWYQKSVETKKTYGLSEKVFITCDSLKRMWRNAHPETVSFWYELEDTVRRAIASPGTTFPCRRLKVRRDKAWLRIVLPSGRAVCYPSPRVDNGQISYMGVNPYSRKWQRLKTYGGKLVENVTQAAARDVLAANMPVIENHGYAIVLTVHDEVLTEAPDSTDFNHEQLSALLATNPGWAPDLPLSAGGFEAYHYRKD